MNPSFLICFGVSALAHALLIFIIAIGIPRAPYTLTSSNNNQVLIVNFLSKKNNSNTEHLSKSVSVNDDKFSPSKEFSSTQSAYFENNHSLLTVPLSQPKYYSFKELDQAPQIIEDIDQNPAELLSSKQGGSLTLQLKIDEVGNVIEVNVLESNLPAEFTESATHSFMQKKFSPGLKGGMSVNSKLVIVVNYSPILENN